MDNDFSKLLSRIKELKDIHGLTNIQLSEKSGVSIGTLNKILSGDTTAPRLPAIAAIAQSLDTTVDYLIYGNNKKPSAQGEGPEWLDTFNSLSEDSKALVRERIQALSELENKSKE